MAGGIERAIINAASVGGPACFQACCLLHACATPVMPSAGAGARAFALDTRTKRAWEAKPLEAVNADAFKAAMKTFGFDPAHVVPHGS